MISTVARVHEPLEAPHAIEVTADPNGLAYDRHTQTLYVADGSGAVFAVENGRPRRIATIDAAGCSENQLGGVTVDRDGALYVARLGHGRAGAIFAITLRGQITQLRGMAVNPWRLGVAYDAGEHALYTTSYHKVAATPCNGAVERIDLATGCVTAVTEGMDKPVGVVRLGSGLVVTDARRGAVLRIGLAGGRAVRCVELATGIDRPDSIAVCGDAVVLTTFCVATGIGSVRKLWLDGTVATIARGSWEPRGIASDGDRTFVALRRTSRILVIRH